MSLAALALLIALALDAFAGEPPNALHPVVCIPFRWDETIRYCDAALPSAFDRVVRTDRRQAEWWRVDWKWVAIRYRNWSS